MSDLVEFVLARVAEDEEVARSTVAYEGDARWVVEYLDEEHTVCGVGPITGDFEDDGFMEHGKANACHVARFDPTRILAECEAKRAIVAMQARPDDIYDVSRFTGDGVFRALALVYADHPDYREEWKP